MSMASYMARKVALLIIKHPLCKQDVKLWKVIQLLKRPRRCLYIKRTLHGPGERCKRLNQTDLLSQNGFSQMVGSIHQFFKKP